MVETHIAENDTTLETEALKNLVPGYLFHHRGRKIGKGGGVGILVSKGLKSTGEILYDMEFVDGNFENVIVKIQNIIPSGNTRHRRDLVIAGIYRQPRADNVQEFCGRLTDLLSVLNRGNAEVIITGTLTLTYSSMTNTSQPVNTSI